VAEARVERGDARVDLQVFLRRLEKLLKQGFLPVQLRGFQQLRIPARGSGVL
jgi:hypothetical protein